MGHMQTGNRYIIRKICFKTNEKRCRRWRSSQSNKKVNSSEIYRSLNTYASNNRTPKCINNNRTEKEIGISIITVGNF